MIFKQLFDQETSTYTYLLADEATKEAVLIDPVIGHIDDYETALESLGLNLSYALDTHVHADHITALGELRERTGCRTFIGRDGSVSCSDESLKDGMNIVFGNHQLKVFYTPGHTDDSYSFLLENDQPMVFTGDTLLINGCGRTDFQNGDAGQLYDSIHEVLLGLPDHTIVYPAHDYHGHTESTIAAERENNPRLQWGRDEFIKNMAALNLPDPKFMDVAVPANRRCGKTFE